MWRTRRLALVGALVPPHPLVRMRAGAALPRASVEEVFEEGALLLPSRIVVAVPGPVPVVLVPVVLVPVVLVPVVLVPVVLVPVVLVPVVLVPVVLVPVVLVPVVAIP